MSTLNIISDFSLTTNFLKFNIEYPFNYGKNSIFIYTNNIRLNNEDYSYTLNNNIVIIIPNKPFEAYDTFITFIKDSEYFSNIMYLFHGINLINTNGLQKNLLLSFAYFPEEMKSNNYVANTLGINSSELPAKEIKISFCNEINSYISFLTYSHRDDKNTYFKISLFDKFSEEAPSNTYILAINLK